MRQLFRSSASNLMRNSQGVIKTEWLLKTEEEGERESERERRRKKERKKINSKTGTGSKLKNKIK